MAWSKPSWNVVYFCPGGWTVTTIRWFSHYWMTWRGAIFGASLNNFGNGALSSFLISGFCDKSDEYSGGASRFPFLLACSRLHLATCVTEKLVKPIMSLVSVWTFQWANKMKLLILGQRFGRHTLPNVLFVKVRKVTLHEPSYCFLSWLWFVIQNTCFLLIGQSCCWELVKKSS